MLELVASRPLAQFLDTVSKNVLDSISTIIYANAVQCTWSDMSVTGLICLYLAWSEGTFAGNSAVSQLPWPEQ